MTAKGFIPARAFIEEGALSYANGMAIKRRLEELRVPVTVLLKGQRPTVPGRAPSAAYAEAKKTLVVRVWKGKEFSTCRPSANYQLPLVTSCPGLCEYCYLQTQLGPRPYIRVYANTDEVLEHAGELTARRRPETIVFEGAATSDPVPVEHITGSLKRCIEYFGRDRDAIFQFVTKFSDVDGLIGASHGGRTTVRFSVNAPHVLRSYEHSTSTLEERLAALTRLRADGYPVGLMIGPVIAFEGWKEQYAGLLDDVGSALSVTDLSDRSDESNTPNTSRTSNTSGSSSLPFEIITHRFTSRAKKNILTVFPHTTLPIDETDRRLVYGQFGYTKYLYSKTKMDEILDFFETEIPRRVPGSSVLYMV